mmetsp:Transcript_28428/g.76741  ORF Transcript_28428/g.76741 Transcript_28428/m.76741 type:complete len:200 (-) Transcript_28428:864-1463(-)
MGGHISATGFGRFLGSCLILLPAFRGIAEARCLCARLCGSCLCLGLSHEGFNEGLGLLCCAGACWGSSLPFLALGLLAGSGSLCLCSCLLLCAQAAAGQQLRNHVLALLRPQLGVVRAQVCVGCQLAQPLLNLCCRQHLGLLSLPGRHHVPDLQRKPPVLPVVAHAGILLLPCFLQGLICIILGLGHFLLLLIHLFQLL